MFGWDKQDVSECTADLLVCMNSEQRHGSGEPCGGPLDAAQKLANDSDQNVVLVTSNALIVYQQMDFYDQTKRECCACRLPSQTLISCNVMANFISLIFRLRYLDSLCLLLCPNRKVRSHSTGRYSPARVRS